MKNWGRNFFKEQELKNFLLKDLLGQFNVIEVINFAENIVIFYNFEGKKCCDSIHYQVQSLENNYFFRYKFSNISSVQLISYFIYTQF